MSLFRQLSDKPWLTAQGTAEDLQAEGMSSLPMGKFALRVLLAVLTVVFSLFVIAYADRMTLGDWRATPEPWILWLNTVLLVLSSVGLHRASVAAGQGRMDGVRTGLLGGGALAFAFLFGQLYAWQQLVDLGYFAASNPANAFFYLITALHGVHLLGGLIAWGRAMIMARQQDDASDQLCVIVDMCATYWHFLLVVWLVLFGLLLFT